MASNVNKQSRRDFLKSIFSMVKKDAGSQKVREYICFYWVDLKSGQIGFPTGIDVQRGLPGSFLHIVLTALALEENLTSNGQNSCGHKNFVQALSAACNTCFTELSRDIDLSLFLDYAKRFGLDLPVGKYAAGIFPQTLENAGVMQDYANGLSEKLQPNALQILRLSALVANKGNVPFMHSAEDRQENQPPFCVQLKPDTWQALQEGMKWAVSEEQLQEFKDKKMPISALVSETVDKSAVQTWLSGYFPSESPRYAFFIGAVADGKPVSVLNLADQYLFSNEWP